MNQHNIRIKQNELQLVRCTIRMQHVSVCPFRQVWLQRLQLALTYACSIYIPIICIMNGSAFLSYALSHAARQCHGYPMSAASVPPPPPPSPDISPTASR